MKKIFGLLALVFVLFSCAVKVPFTNEVRQEFGLDSEEKMRKVQFFTSSTIILKQVAQSSSETTTDDSGVLVSSSTDKSETIIIPANSKCIFESFGSNKEINIRFELGENKYLSFKSKSNKLRDRYYFVANWSASGGPELMYGNKKCKVDMMRGAARSSYIIVSRKRLQKNKRKERVVGGMKV
ncbi:MAG: hypothetical protein CL857_04055 [Cryomorphaceae bacterium]|nr:hypothetical protein [Cryomorphaceae bacterium]|tara:strand:- start:515 stop:1063 length:549 start_codon:yes stop_codon:yes gene_type:complete